MPRHKPFIVFRSSYDFQQFYLTWILSTFVSTIVLFVLVIIAKDAAFISLVITGEAFLYLYCIALPVICELLTMQFIPTDRNQERLNLIAILAFIIVLEVGFYFGCAGERINSDGAIVLSIIFLLINIFFIYNSITIIFLSRNQMKAN